MAFSDLKIHKIKSNEMSVTDIWISVFDVGHNLVSALVHPANVGWHHCCVDNTIFKMV